LDRDDTRSKDWTIRDEKNETIHEDKDSLIHGEKTEKTTQYIQQQYLRNGRQARVIAPL